jgi:hypothetical protein
LKQSIGQYQVPSAKGPEIGQEKDAIQDIKLNTPCTGYQIALGSLGGRAFYLMLK